MNSSKLRRGDRAASMPPGESRRHMLVPGNPGAITRSATPVTSTSSPLNEVVNVPGSPKALDSISTLIRSVAGVVKSRNGSVLSRGMILKSDHYPSGRAAQLEINLQGAPNFRSSRRGSLNVFGVAQPRLQGLKAILSILGCRPGVLAPLRCIWFSTREEPIVYIAGRPFVLRDSADPRRNLALSDRTENLEAIEQRLKSDILSESVRFGGLILTHNEIAEGEGAIIPTWTQVDSGAVKTSRELWTTLSEQGWNVQYHRIPISPERPIEDNYLDAYLRVLLERSADPSMSSLVFSCGMGVVRSTFAMCAASIVRRKQIIMSGLPDPYEIISSSSGITSRQPRGGPPGSGKLLLEDSGRATPPGVQAALALEQVEAQHEFSKSLLRLTYILQQCLQSKNSQSAIELLLSRPTLMENLGKAHAGSYGVVLSLLGCLDNGLLAKRLVDKVIDSCDHVVNLREDILLHRIKYSLTTMGDKDGDIDLEKAAKALEKYFFLMAFAGYVEEQTDFKGESFGNWMKARPEIWNQVSFLRKTMGSRLNIFAPVSDLSVISKTGSEGNEFEAGPKNDVAISGGLVLGDEWTTHVIENRRGIVLRPNTLLKSDQWLNESAPTEDAVRGAINFRNVPNTNIYALGQPTLEAIDEVIRRIKSAHPSAKRIVWLTLREEPIVYVNGVPFCLRRDSFSLRNMKDYSGVSAQRLETLEDRLKSDAISELESFGDRLLLHTETVTGSVIPIWDEVHPENISVIKDIMDLRKASQDIELHHHRIPITAEHPIDFADIAAFLEVVIRTGKDTPIVVNCQLGRGRSTIASILLVLIQNWLHEGYSNLHPQRPRASSAGLLAPSSTYRLEEGQVTHRHHSYKVINNVLRVIRSGLEVKAAVDDAIDQCSKFFNLRDSIDDAWTQAEVATDERQKRRHVEIGIHNLRRYFQLVIFQAYLNATTPNTLRDMETFEAYVKHRPVFETFEQEIFTDGIHALKPLQHMEVLEGFALSDEVTRVVANRSGTILSASTILKSDFFLNLQKMSLPERLDGAPNFRRVPLILQLIKFSPTTDELSEDSGGFSIMQGQGQMQVCGSGMPTIDGLRRALSRVDAGITGKNRVAWTSLREEPVLYVAGRPHVLRLIDQPLENVEATGITKAVVERMERAFREDVIREMRINGGSILLHDEKETETGTFDIIPQWEKVSEVDILTPRDVFELVANEGFKVDYARIPITDEQAPLPSALAQLLERVRASLKEADDLIFNCQMGRGRTTTGMVAACLISTIFQHDFDWNAEYVQGNDLATSWSLEGPSPDEAYLQGDYKMILQLVGVLSYGKVAKWITDLAIDHMQDVQNLRGAIFDYKLKVHATIPGSMKHKKLTNVAINYLYRYGTLIVFADYLIELREKGDDANIAIFPDWLNERREIAKLLARRSLD